MEKRSLTTAATLRRAIAEKQWTQKQFRAELAAAGYECTHSTVSKVVRGKHAPSDTMRFAIEAILGLAFESWE